MQKHTIDQGVINNILSVLSLLLIAAVAATFLITTAFTSSLNQKMSDRYSLGEQAERLCSASKLLTSEVRSYAATGDKTNYDNYWYEVNTAKNRDEAIAIMQEIGMAQDEQELIEAIGARSNSLIPFEEQAMQAVAAGNNAKAREYVYGNEYSTGIAEIYDMTDTFKEKLDTRTQNETQALLNSQNTVIAMTIIVIALLLLFQIYFVIYVASMRKNLVVPVRQIGGELKKIADGELSGVELDHIKTKKNNTEVNLLKDSAQNMVDRLSAVIADIEYLLGEMAGGNFRLQSQAEDKYVGEFFDLLKSTRQINRQLNSTLFCINQAAEQVKSSAEQVSTDSQSLSQGASEQAASVEELSASLVEIARQVDDNVATATSASELSERAGQAMDAGRNQMSSLTEAMDTINKNSNEIGKIIKTIEDIAFQTNILALNAAVEAARAGVAGKGFAVVADEVRNLAGKSAEAAKGTTQLIESAVTAISNGTQIAQQTARSLESIVEASEQMNNAVHKIAQASHAQSESISSLKTGMEQISRVVQVTAATAEQSAAASEEMSGQAAILRSQVDRFTLRSDSDSTQMGLLNSAG